MSNLLLAPINQTATSKIGHLLYFSFDFVFELLLIQHFFLRKQKWNEITFNHKELFFSFTSHTQCFCFFSVNFLSFFFFVALKQNALFDERTWPPINRALSSYLSSRDLWKPPKHYGHWLQLKKMKKSLNWHHLFSVFIRIVMFKFLSKFEWVRNQKESTGLIMTVRND